MSEINSHNDNKYKVLEENDYNITIEDQGDTIFGGIHKVDYEEKFSIKNPKAELTDEAPIHIVQWSNACKHIYVNNYVDNNDTLLILGDSYIDSFLYDDLAESFHKVVQIWGDFISGNFEEVMNYYNPSIVIIENAERVDRSNGIINAANMIEND